MDNNRKPENLTVISVKSCTPGHADRAESGEKIAILRLLAGSTPQQPMLLSIYDVKKLIVALTDVLSFHQIDLPAELRDSLIFTAPTADRPVRNTACPAIAPSRRAASPTGPIQSDEVANFLAGLAVVKTWPDLVKHIGATDAPSVAKPKPRRKKGKGRNGK